jgi:hypothetical protein
MTTCLLSSLLLGHLNLLLLIHDQELFVPINELVRVETEVAAFALMADAEIGIKI